MSRNSVLGITIGKFDPFHLGHSYLISEAKKRCRRLVVVVGARADDPIRGWVRADWITEEHPDVLVLWTEADLPDEPGPWADECLGLLGGRKPDVAFTSEVYGDAWAEAMGARHEQIHLDRRRFPINATMVRENPALWWDWLAPSARAGLIQRVVVAGAESTGTTTLAKDLAALYGTTWVPEYGRVYWEVRQHRHRMWEEWEFETIMKGQAHLEGAMARIARRVLICDTDPLVTMVFGRRYMRRPSEAIERAAAERVPNAYTIAGDEIPWVQDGTRESEGEREQMQELIREAVVASGAPWIEVHGTPEERVEQAVAFIERAAPFPEIWGPTDYPSPRIATRRT